MIFNIQRDSTHDGPGIRTVVFFKGCPLDCLWCQNPEGRALRKRDLMFDASRCLPACSLCQQRAPQAISRQGERLQIQRCQLSEDVCEQLAHDCPTQALSVCGEERTLDEIMHQLLKDRPFYQKSGGGVTLSGGEPFMQPRLACRLLQACAQQGMHTAVESCLQVPWANIEPSLPHLDLMLADLKQVDAQRYHEQTGGKLAIVHDNLRRLSRSPVELCIRIPLIPGFNTDTASLRGLCQFVAEELGGTTIHFLPYHTLGMAKYRMLGQPYRAPVQGLQDPACYQEAQAWANHMGLVAHFGE